MTEQPAAYPGYATPTFKASETIHGTVWLVAAGHERVGWVQGHDSGWTAHVGGQCVGLFPDKQAAGEALVKHAGYELL